MVEAAVESEEDDELVVKFASKAELDIFEEKLKAKEKFLKSKLVIIWITKKITKYQLLIRFFLFLASDKSH